MLTIEKAIEEFRDRRLSVYKTDKDQVVRDTRATERTSKDHIGRWLFELLQNCDDAKATKVLIRVDNGVVYVADNGNGLKPEAVSAICGMDLSDKTSGTIGRKGVGFKSVYEITSTPQVLTVNGDGIEFSFEKTKVWLEENNIQSEYVPHPWIPFFISWELAQCHDPILCEFVEYKTVV